MHVVQWYNSPRASRQPTGCLLLRQQQQRRPWYHDPPAATNCWSGRSNCNCNCNCSWPHTARRRYHADMAQAAGDDDAAARSGDLDHCGGAAASGGMVDGSGGAAGGPPRVFRLDRASDYVTPDDTVRHLAFMCALIKATNRFIAVAAAAAETA